MKVQIENKTFNLDVERAKQLGVLRESKTFNIPMDENEVAVLVQVLNRVGGSPEGVRGYCNNVLRRLRDLDASCDKAIIVDGESPRGSLYFK